MSPPTIALPGVVSLVKYSLAGALGAVLGDSMTQYSHSIHEEGRRPGLKSREGKLGQWGEEEDDKLLQDSEDHIGDLQDSWDLEHGLRVVGAGAMLVPLLIGAPLQWFSRYHHTLTGLLWVSLDLALAELTLAPLLYAIGTNQTRQVKQRIPIITFAIGAQTLATSVLVGSIAGSFKFKATMASFATHYYTGLIYTYGMGWASVGYMLFTHQNALTAEAERRREGRRLGTEVPLSASLMDFATRFTGNLAVLGSFLSLVYTMRHNFSWHWQTVRTWYLATLLHHALLTFGDSTAMGTPPTENLTPYRVSYIILEAGAVMAVPKFIMGGKFLWAFTAESVVLGSIGLFMLTYSREYTHLRAPGTYRGASPLTLEPVERAETEVEEASA